MEHLLLIALGVREVIRLSAQLRSRPWNAAFQGQRWGTTCFVLGTGVAAILIGLSKWLPTARIGWFLCGIAILFGTKAPCGISPVNRIAWLRMSRNALFIAGASFCVAYALEGFLRYPASWLRVLAIPIGTWVTFHSARKVRRRIQRYPWQHDGVRSVIAWTVFGLCLVFWGTLGSRIHLVPAGLAVASIATVRCSLHRVFNEHRLLAPARDMFFLAVGIAIAAYGLGVRL